MRKTNIEEEGSLDQMKEKTGKRLEDHCRGAGSLEAYGKN